MLPLVCAHPSRVAAEGIDPDAVEVVLAGFVRETTAEIDRVPVSDA
jgi:hypothetical protein